MAWVVYIALFLIPVAEGYREYLFYLINKAARFSLRAEDVLRKHFNTALYGAAVLPLIYLLTGAAWLHFSLVFCAAVFWRWVALDGVLNWCRHLGFFYAGNSGRSFTDIILHPLPIPARAAVKFLPLIGALILILYLYG